MNVHKLETNVISQIKTSYTITNTAQCVTELILNSLDANSTSIAIRINLNTFLLQIIDNGDGISEENLQKIGLHHYSTKSNQNNKSNNRKLFGSHGDSLANILNMSESIEIVSRPKNRNNTFKKVLTSKERADIILCEKNRASFGTTLTIVGFLSKLPVRKQRIKTNLELNELKTILERFALINPRVSFTLRNNLNEKLEFSCEKRESITESLCYFYPELIENVKQMKIKRKQTKIEALFVNTECRSKVHYIYVNKRPVECPKVRKLLYDLFNIKQHPIYIININISRSKVDFAENRVNFNNWPFIERLITKLVNKYLGKSEEVVANVQHTVPVLPDVLNVIKGGPVKRKRDQNCEIFAKKPHINPELTGKQLIMDMFLKSTQVYASQDDFLPNDTLIESNFYYEKSFRSKTGKLNTTMSVSLKFKSIRKALDVKKVSKGLQTSFSNPPPSYEEKAIQTSFINDSFDNFQPQLCSTVKNARESQLVFSLPQNANKSLLERDLKAENAIITSPFFTTNPTDNEKSIINEDSLNNGGIFEFKPRFSHLPKGFSPICATMNSPNVSLSQNSKEKLYDLLLGSLESELLNIKWNGDGKTCLENVYKSKAKQIMNDIPTIYDKHYKKFNKRLDDITFTKELLQQVEILGQLDYKFIVGMIKSMSLLVIFDQHAVHERIRLECLQTNYKNERVQLDSPILLFVTSFDLSLLKNNMNYLNDLGFACNFLTNCLFMNEIPACLHNKIKNNSQIEEVCKMILNEIVDLLKIGNFSKRLPEIMQKIINLEACRGAIKFGDALTNEECFKLVQELGKCDLPFQCAHGRPTIQPMVRICSEFQKENQKVNLKELKNQTAKLA